MIRFVVDAVPRQLRAASRFVSFLVPEKGGVILLVPSPTQCCPTIPTPKKYQSKEGSQGRAKYAPGVINSKATPHIEPKCDTAPYPHRHCMCLMLEEATPIATSSTGIFFL